MTYEHNLLTYERYIRGSKFTPGCNFAAESKFAPFAAGSKFAPGCKLCI